MADGVTVDKHSRRQTRRRGFGTAIRGTRAHLFPPYDGTNMASSARTSHLGDGFDDVDRCRIAVSTPDVHTSGYRRSRPRRLPFPV